MWVAGHTPGSGSTDYIEWLSARTECANPPWEVASKPADRTSWNGLPLGTAAGSSPTGLVDVVPRARQTPRLSGLHRPLVERSLSSGSRDTFPVARARGGRGNSALTPLPGNGAAHNASAVLNDLRRDRKRPRNCCRHKDARSPRKAPWCATIPPLATVSGPVGPAPAKVP